MRSHVIFRLASKCPKCLPSLLHHSPCAHVLQRLRLVREADSWRPAAGIKDSVHSLQENITKDVEANASVGLDTSKASRATLSKRGVVDVLAWNGEGLAANGHVEVWWAGRAGDGVSTLRAVELSALHLAVVGLHSAGWKVEKRSASIKDGGAEAASRCVIATSRGATSSELPETLRVVHWDVGNGTSVLGAVDVAKRVATLSLVFEVDGEQSLG